MVGAVRVELTTSCTRNKRATGLRYAPTQKHILPMKFPKSNAKVFPPWNLQFEILHIRVGPCPCVVKTFSPLTFNLQPNAVVANYVLSHSCANLAVAL
jgi:hypothetical protein